MRAVVPCVPFGVKAVSAEDQRAIEEAIASMDVDACVALMRAIQERFGVLPSPDTGANR
jgi:DNA-binding GntR family transcriptional regulator